MSELSRFDTVLDRVRRLERRIDQLEAQLVARTGWVLRGDVTPEGNITAEPGTIYLWSNGGASITLYVKESGGGTTGWVAK
jgi:hypothetical protein